MTADQKMAKAAELYDANIAAARGLSAGTSPFGAGAPIFASRPAASATPGTAPASPDDAITAKSRHFWQGRGINLPWWGAQPAAPGAPVARGILDVQGPPKPPGPGSVSDYEAQHNLANIPDVPYAAPEILRHPMAGPRACRWRERGRLRAAAWVGPHAAAAPARRHRQHAHRAEALSNTPTRCAYQPPTQIAQDAQEKTADGSPARLVNPQQSRRLGTKPGRCPKEMRPCAKQKSA